LTVNVDGAVAPTLVGPGSLFEYNWTGAAVDRFADVFGICADVGSGVNTTRLPAAS
jgi:hypothetical protein